MNEIWHIPDIVCDSSSRNYPFAIRIHRLLDFWPMLTDEPQLVVSTALGYQIVIMELTEQRNRAEDYLFQDRVRDPYPSEDLGELRKMHLSCLDRPCPVDTRMPRVGHIFTTMAGGDEFDRIRSTFSMSEIWGSVSARVAENRMHVSQGFKIPDFRVRVCEKTFGARAGVLVEEIVRWRMC
jgi:hypothetical protein